jgi:predicted RNA-binding protein with PIN domain
MNYLIDGHNLIAQIAGLSLSMPDDEARLIELLDLFCRRGKQRVEVFFDRAPSGHAGTQTFGHIKAHFVHHSGTADQAIRNKLKALKNSARNWVVVSSDRSIQVAAREAHAAVLASEAFARLLYSSMRSEVGEVDAKPKEPLSEAEIQEWLKIFKGKPGSKDPNL